MSKLIVIALLLGCGGTVDEPCIPQLVCVEATKIDENLSSPEKPARSGARWFMCEGVCANGRTAWMWFEEHAGVACDADRKIWLKWVVNATDC